MATFKTCVFKHQQREDNKFPISIRVTTNRQSAYINTGIYAVKSQISKDFKSIKDTELARTIDRKIEKFEQFIIRNLAPTLKQYSARQLCDILTRSTSDNQSIDFINFSTQYIEKLQKNGQLSYSKLMASTVNALVDFFGRPNVSINEITANSLSHFVDYIKTPRRICRTDQFGRKTTRNYPAVSDRTAADYLTKIRTLFNAALDKYNDQDSGVMLITHYPFRKLKIKTTHISQKRNLPIEIIKLIRDTPIAPTHHRQILARDVFMLSFYLVGMNLVDMFTVESIKNWRINYNRVKTTSRREDGAYISILVEDEAKPIIEKYRDPKNKRIFDFYTRYSDHRNFVRAVNSGLAQLCEELDLETKITSYFARHSWATIARNDCKVRLEDINLALNHVDRDMKITDIYIARDWTLIDAANRLVLDCLKD